MFRAVSGTENATTSSSSVNDEPNKTKDIFRKAESPWKSEADKVEAMKKLPSFLRDPIGGKPKNLQPHRCRSFDDHMKEVTQLFKK